MGRIIACPGATVEGFTAVHRRVIPFRWNFGNPKLWRRIGGDKAPAPPAHLDLHENVLRCAAAILRAADDADVYFVGRSLENVHDFLTGALGRTRARERIRLIQLSLRDASPRELRRENPGALENLWLYFDALELTPSKILARPRPVAFADLVCSGGTFGSLLRVLRCWLGHDLEEWRRLRARLRWVCVVERDHPEFEPWDPEHVDWADHFARGQLRCIPIPYEVWRYLGEDQPKTTRSYRPDRWGRKAARKPPSDSESLEAARMARSFYRLGERWRRRLADELEKPVMPSVTVGALVRELRG